jgi:hypothetical protein
MWKFPLFLLICSVAAAAADPAVDLLRGKDQALLDAIAPGDRKVWDTALAPDAVYVDENGVIMNRATLHEATGAIARRSFRKSSHRFLCRANQRRPRHCHPHR